jgi:putative thioredoxin
MQEFELRSDFAREVLDESQRVPVLVDFWAPWCGPCKVLSPILAKLVREAVGAWKLVTVNSDVNTDLAGALRIQSIPTVFLFSQGQPIATFSGALPEKDVREWLRRYIPAPAAEPGASEATLAFQAGRLGEAKRLLAKALEKDPQDSAARLLLARALFAEDIEKASETASAIPEEAEHREAVEHFLRLRDLVRWERGKDAGRAVTGPEADVALYLEGTRAVREGDYGTALEKWLTLVQRNRALDEDGARKALVALLVVLGEENPLTREYRRRLASVLF